MNGRAVYFWCFALVVLGAVLGYPLGALRELIREQERRFRELGGPFIGQATENDLHNYTEGWQE